MLSKRLSRLEQAERSAREQERFNQFKHLLATGHPKVRMSDDEILAWVRAAAKADEIAPPIDLGNGKVDAEPTIRCFARLLGLDENEAVAEGQAILRGRGAA